MFHFILLLLSLLILTCLLEFAHLASFLPSNKDIPVNSSSPDAKRNQIPMNLTPIPDNPIKTISTTTAAQYDPTIMMTTTQSSHLRPELLPTTTQRASTTSESFSTTTIDPNADPDDIVPPNVSPNPDGKPITLFPDKVTPNKSHPTGDGNKPQAGGYPSSQSATLELTVLFYSVFMIYVSFTKLIYHNVVVIKRNLTEPGILMIFGMIWELIVRQISSNYDSFPKFNSQIFFYLFLPSTVLESAALLSNKWLFINILPILVHSIIGTLVFASSIGFSIHSLDQQNVFKFTYHDHKMLQPTTASSLDANDVHYNVLSLTNSTLMKLSRQDHLKDVVRNLQPILSYATDDSTIKRNNLTLADCLVFGTILSSIDTSIILNVFSQFRINEKLYYLVLGEGLLNNAVVLVMFDILLEFFNENKLTMVKIYIVVLQFFLTLLGSIFIGITLACVALFSVRLINRFQVPASLSSYQNQCQAMVETLLILKLAYLAYTLASAAGTSRIVSLATFGILQDQYIKHTLNLRSQLTLKQVILATRTLGFSLVYPLLGMLLIEVANTTQFAPMTWRLFESASMAQGPSQSIQIAGRTTSNELISSSQVSTMQHDRSTNQENFYWNFRFLSMVIVLTFFLRFLIVMVLSIFCNLFSSRQLGIRFREQLLVAYGGLKGPLAFALVHRLIEHEEYRDRAMRNKYLFMYSILFITLISTLVKGSLIRPLVSRMQTTLCQRSATEDQQQPLNATVNSSMVFNHINFKVTEHVSHGMNSILGHRKSPYDRFIDFNELQLKPWLARDGSNTNWLSVFYDDLMLDETLNANCFYRSTELSPSLQVHMRALPPYATAASGGTQRWGRSCSLDTIAENQLPTHIGRPAPASTGSASLVSSATRKAKQLEGFRSPCDKNLLKEFVMLNLKLEKSRQHKTKSRIPKCDNLPATKVKRKINGSKVKPVSNHDATSDDDWSEQPVKNKVQARMLSTTSDEDQAIDHKRAGANHQSVRLDKQKNLDELERRLNDGHQQRFIRDSPQEATKINTVPKTHRARAIIGRSTELRIRPDNEQIRRNFK